MLQYANIVINESQMSGDDAFSGATAAALTPAYFARAADLFGAMADPVRLALLRRLMAGEGCVGALVEVAGVKQPTVSKHLGVLEKAGLVHGRREGSFMFYSIADPVVHELCGLVCASIRRRSEAELRALSS
jgi:DNA-binding transcriptional ArsR family regulator